MANKAPTSPMEIDDGNSKRDGKDGTDHLRVHNPLASCGKLTGYQYVPQYINQNAGIKAVSAKENLKLSLAPIDLYSTSSFEFQR